MTQHAASLDKVEAAAFYHGHPMEVSVVPPHTRNSIEQWAIHGMSVIDMGDRYVPQTGAGP